MEKRFLSTKFTARTKRANSKICSKRIWISGDQVDPDDPRQCLLVKREMMVEDPGTAEGRWSLDFLMVDQDGIPTLVECKRFRDTRARREVIGQMFDYAANASLTT